MRTQCNTLSQSSLTTPVSVSTLPLTPSYRIVYMTFTKILQYVCNIYVHKMCMTKFLISQGLSPSLVIWDFPKVCMDMFC